VRGSDRVTRRPRAETYIGAVFVALVLGYGIWIAFATSGPVGPRVGFGSDSAVYLAAARHPVWTMDFLAAPGPFAFLLVLKLCARNLRVLVLVQSCASAAAWLYLASTVRATMRTRAAQLAGFTGLLLVGCSPRVIEWNAFVASESISVTLLCVAIALGIRLVTGAGRRTLVLFLVTLVALGFTRDTNALTLLPVAALVLVGAFVHWISWRGALITAGVAVITAAIAMSLSGRADPPRWYWPLNETTVLRLVGDDTAEPYLVAHGFPLDHNVRALHDNFAFMHEQMTKGADFRPLREWVRRDGRSTYTRFLATHPAWTLARPLDDVGPVLTPAVEGYSRVIFHNDPPDPYGWLGTIGWPGSQLVAGSWLAGAAAVIIVVAVRRPDRRRFACALGFLGVIAIAGYYAAFHGDALEVPRHALTSAVALRIVAWTAVALAIDEFGASVVEAVDAEEDEGEDQGFGRDDEPADAQRARG
jgi:hypothetical protein